jgi:hypothetical protein
MSLTADAPPMVGPGFFHEDCRSSSCVRRRSTRASTSTRRASRSSRRAFASSASSSRSWRDRSATTTSSSPASGASRRRSSRAASPCRASVKHLSEAQALEIMVVENNQREDVNALEEADGFSRLLKAGYDIDRLAERLGRSKKYVYDRVKLLDLAAPAKALLFDQGC